MTLQFAIFWNVIDTEFHWSITVFCLCVLHLYALNVCIISVITMKYSVHLKHSAA